jgi:hypothetical protein
MFAGKAMTIVGLFCANEIALFGSCLLWDIIKTLRRRGDLLALNKSAPERRFYVEALAAARYAIELSGNKFMSPESHLIQ